MATRKADDTAPKTSGAKTVRSTLTYPYVVDLSRFDDQGRPKERRSLTLLPQQTHTIVAGTPGSSLQLRESEWAEARKRPQVAALMESAKIVEG